MSLFRDNQGVTVNEKTAHLICNVLPEPHVGVMILLANPLFEEEASTFFNGCEHENGNSPSISLSGGDLMNSA